MTSETTINTQGGTAIQGNVAATTFIRRDAYITNITQVLQDRPAFFYRRTLWGVGPTNRIRRLTGNDPARQAVSLNVFDLPHPKV